MVCLCLTVGLFSSCNGKNEEVSGYEGEYPIYTSYLANVTNIEPDENEVFTGVTEIDGKIRLTVGVTDNELKSREIDLVPYRTEYRYYDMELNRLSDQYEQTNAFYEIAISADPTDKLVLGGKQYIHEESTGEKQTAGLLLQYYIEDSPVGRYIVPTSSYDDDRSQDSHLWAVAYDNEAHLIMSEETVYCAVNYGMGYELFVEDEYLSKPGYRPGQPEYEVCGVMELQEKPYALLRVWESNRNGQVVDVSKETARLIPLTPDMTELTLDGLDIDGVPTGGAFSDDKCGYFLCGSELWRTDGKKSECISNLAFCGIANSLDVRSVCRLTDGRILLVTAESLIMLEGSSEGTSDTRQILTIGVINLYGDTDRFAKSLATYNRKASDHAFAIKEYSSVADMNLALLSGEISVVLTRDQFLLKNYAKQGYLASLEENVPALFEDGILIENIVNATRVDGICYYLPRTFSIKGEMTTAELLPFGSTFESMEEYFNFIEKKDSVFFDIRMPKDIFVTYAQNLDEWIDWENREAYFDSGTFETLLEFCEKGATAEEVEINASQASTINTQEFYVEDLVDVFWCEDIAYVQYGKSEETWDRISKEIKTTYPMPSKVYEGYEIYAPFFVAVVNNDISLEETRKLMEFYFLEDVVKEFQPGDMEAVQNGYYGMGFSINKDECRRYLERFEKLPEENFPLYYEERYERTWDYIEKGDHFQYFRNEIFDVMYEEAGRYFAGSISAKQAAEYTQNRISIYLAEQS